ncbi:hypothetical protein ACLOJK_020133 [Asimina triloba]
MCQVSQAREASSLLISFHQNFSRYLSRERSVLNKTKAKRDFSFLFFFIDFVFLIFCYCCWCWGSAMEVITEGVNNVNIAATGDAHKKNRIQVSNTKKPLFFYVNLAKRYMQQHDEVELSALGMAIATVVTIAEILKNNGLAVEKSEIKFPQILTSTVDMKDESRGRSIQKAKGADLVRGLTVATVGPKKKKLGPFGTVPTAAAVGSAAILGTDYIEILLGKTLNFDELMAATAQEREAGDGEEQS